VVGEPIAHTRLRRLRYRSIPDDDDETNRALALCPFHPFVLLYFISPAIGRRRRFSSRRMRVGTAGGTGSASASVAGASEAAAAAAAVAQGAAAAAGTPTETATGSVLVIVTASGSGSGNATGRGGSLAQVCASQAALLVKQLVKKHETTSATTQSVLTS
jgi:hypothetical protein